MTFVRFTNADEIRLFFKCKKYISYAVESGILKHIDDEVIFPLDMNDHTCKYDDEYNDYEIDILGFTLCEGAVWGLMHSRDNLVSDIMIKLLKCYTKNKVDSKIEYLPYISWTTTDKSNAAPRENVIEDAIDTFQYFFSYTCA